MASIQLPLKTHRGGCHCRAVRFQVEAPTRVEALDCNCSVCKMKRNVHFVVPSSRFQLLEGRENLTLYQFNTKTAKHYFCKTCGVQAFYIPRSNPDGYAVTVACVDPGTLEQVDVVPCDGENWETYMAENRSRFDAMSSAT